MVKIPRVGKAAGCAAVVYLCTVAGAQEWTPNVNVETAVEMVAAPTLSLATYYLGTMRSGVMEKLSRIPAIGVAVWSSLNHLKEHVNLDALYAQTQTDVVYTGMQDKLYWCQDKIADGLETLANGPIPPQVADNSIPMIVTASIGIIVLYNLATKGAGYAGEKISSMRGSSTGE